MPTLSPNPPMITPTSVEKTPHTPEQPPKSTGSTMNSPHPTPPEIKLENNVTVNNNPPTLPVLKRPILVSKDYEATLEEEDLSLELLYDYTTLNAW